jgi:hypothetical protein
VNSGSFEQGILNLTNWVGNVIMPTVAVLFVILAVYQFSKGRGSLERYIVGAMAALCVSGLLRLAEAFVQAGSGADQYYTAILTLVSWVGNVIMPVYAGIEVVRALIEVSVGSQMHIREKTTRHLMAAGGCLCISALTRLLEHFITSGTQIGG